MYVCMCVICSVTCNDCGDFPRVSFSLIFLFLSRGILSGITVRIKTGYRQIKIEQSKCQAATISYPNEEQHTNSNTSKRTNKNMSA